MTGGVHAKLSSRSSLEVHLFRSDLTPLKFEEEKVLRRFIAEVFFQLYNNCCGRMKRRSVLVLFHFLIFSTHLSSSSANGNAETPIKTVVVLVMENRSFDHMLGWLKRLNPEIDGLTGTESNPVNTSEPNSKCVFVSDRGEFVDPDPGHSFQAIREQVFGSKKSVDDEARDEFELPRMNGFVQQAREMNYGPDFAERIMGAFRPEVIPVTTALAMEFAVFDRWFASAPTSTQPNRMYVHSATSHGAISNVPWNLTAGYPQKTIFESLEEAGFSWNVFYQNIPATLFFRKLRNLENLFKFKPYFPWFDIDCKNGELANYVVIEQRYFDLKTEPANDDHPSHDVAEGQKLIKEVYEKLRASPQWNQTLFLITYDEHGGFYDHIATPVTHIPNPDGMNASYPEFFAFNRLGVRVPTIAISPWINKGLVVHEPRGPTSTSQYEHSSIPATVKHIFNLPSFLSKRDEWAGTFHHLFTQRTQPREDCPTELPTPPWSVRHVEANESRKLTEFQQELVLLAAQLNGDHMNANYLNIGKDMTVREGNDYVTEATAHFLEEAQNHLIPLKS